VSDGIDLDSLLRDREAWVRDSRRIERHGDDCLAFKQLHELVVAKASPSLAVIRHLAGCERCRTLLEKFRET
jgi:hypothetical protein